MYERLTSRQPTIEKKLPSSHFSLLEVPKKKFTPISGSFSKQGFLSFLFKAVLGGFYPCLKAFLGVPIVVLRC